MNQRVDPNQAAQQAMMLNMQARQAVLARGVNMTQSIASQTLQGNPRGQVLNFPLRNVGLIKRLIVKVTGTIVQAAAETLTRTTFSGSNIFSNIILTDLANQTRINTTGWHLHILATAKRQAAYGAAFTSDSPVGIGSNFGVNTIPSPVTTVQTFRWFYEIPLSYSDTDLRGAIWANVVNATMNLQLTVNPNFVVASTANPTTAVYISNGTDLGTVTMAVEVYQNYLDQIPMTAQGPILPLQDLSTVYLLNNTVVSGLVTGTDVAIPYANFRDFMSTVFIYDNFGSAQAVGTEINYWALQSANYTNIWKIDPFMAALQTRNLIGDDFPAQLARTTYFFNTRDKPISTVQYGNMQIVANFAQVQASTSQLLVGYEALAIQNQITQAGSLYNT